MLTTTAFRALALSKAGRPYIWGAKGPSNFDCSGLVTWLLTQCGRRTSGCAADLYRQTAAVTGTPKPGDLVFLLNMISAKWEDRVRAYGNRAGHVAIITAALPGGDFEIVEARSSREGVVKTTLSYWKRRGYYGGVRRFAGLTFADEPPAPARTPLHFRLVTWNILGRRFDYAHTWATRLPRVIARLRRVLADDTDAGASVLCLTECRTAEAEEIGKALGMRWVNHLGSTILFSPAWTLTGHWARTWLGSTHGTVIAELTRDGHTVNVVCGHMPPFATRAARRRQIAAEVRELTEDWSDPTILAGDLNDKGPAPSVLTAAGWSNAATKAATRIRADYRTNGAWSTGKAIDWVLGKRVEFRSFRVLRGWHPTTHKTASDHHLVTVQVTVN